ncbi:arylamine N-acetyltransferase, pineal gland isozyme NAT-10 isoform X1 [Cyprinodon tularosa]|uniref:arylamine N-acetyltransferase, pineal gland isozyme NAT-10 isoform X1 n=2 Tax=Cyprinodon tularosa TaxID=77115 RepID=UPI0018E27CF7|nr:arylamine N-acetyltransferase, pineal gland isozyme NAT-10 isoform X1 [Cyprinodon tularosa]
MSSSAGEMNLDEYFQRIGFQGPRDKPDLETLTLIHRLHIMSIPFENLSIHCGEWNTIDLEVIFNKLVRSSRGGWCLENNSLFGWVLREIGFNVTTLGARVFNSTTNDFSPREGHLVNMVQIDGKAYIADVNFGVSSQIWEPLEIVSGKDQPQAAGVFRLINKGDNWNLEKTGRKPEVLNPEFSSSGLVNRMQTYQIYCFTLEPREAHNFTETNQALQTDPTSLFINKSICSLQTPSGFKALIGWTYSEVTYKPEEGVDVFDIRDITEDELDQVLKEQFHLRLQKKMKPANKKACYTLSKITRILFNDLFDNIQAAFNQMFILCFYSKYQSSKCQFKVLFFLSIKKIKSKQVNYFLL